MATSGELIKTCSHVLGIPEATVTTYYRSLREAGLVTKGGRGPSAAKMTPSDATRLLIACGGARFEREPAASVVHDYLQLRSLQSTYWTDSLKSVEVNAEGVWTIPKKKIARLQALGPHHGIDEAIRALIESLVTKVEIFSGRHLIAVSFHGPKPAADISLDLGLLAIEEWREVEKAHYHLPKGSDAEASSLGSGDLRVRREFTAVTLHAIADLLRGGRDG